MISATMGSESARMLAYLRRVRYATGQHVTPMDLVCRAAGKVLEGLPGLNGRLETGDVVAGS